MKKVVLLLLSFLTIGHYAAFSQAPPIQWDQAYGGNDFEKFSFIKQTTDGGYISGGVSQSPVSGSKSQDNWDASNLTTDYWVVKSDANGVKQWDKRFGGDGMESFHSLQQTTDGGYIIGGYTESNISGDVTQFSKGGKDYWVIKIDSVGTKKWDARFGGMADDILYNIIQTADGGYLLCGFSDSDAGGDKSQNSQGAKDYWIVKISDSGNKQWDKTIGGDLDDFAYTADQTTDNGYLICGTSTSGISGDHTEGNRGPLGTMDYWAVKTDSLGNIEWDRRFGTKNDDICVTAQQTADGGYVLGGFSGGTINGDRTAITRGSYDNWIVKLDPLGTKQWDQAYGGSNLDYLFSLIVTSDGGLLIGGTSYSDISGDKTEVCRGNEDYWIIKTDSDGIQQWDKTMGGIDSDWLTDIYETSDGFYVCGGWSSSDVSGEKTQPLVGSSDYWVVKLGQPTPLPVELISFNATPQNKFIQLKWSTASEKGNSSFELQRSLNAIDFEKIYSVNGQGNSNNINHYFYDDINVVADKLYYYRLKQIDFNGAIKFSNTVAAKISDLNSMDLFITENPLQQSAVIYYYLPDESNVQIILNDATGKQIAVLKSGLNLKGLHFLKIDKAQLHVSAGMFFVTLKTPSQSMTKKLVIE